MGMRKRRRICISCFLKKTDAYSLPLPDGAQNQFLDKDAFGVFHRDILGAVRYRLFFLVEVYGER